MAPVSVCCQARPQHFGDAEVGDLHPALFVEQDVFRLDVAVDDALFVGVLQRLADFRNDGERLGGRQLSGLQQLSQRQAVHKLHQQIETSPHLTYSDKSRLETCTSAEIIDGDDVRMIQPRQRVGFALESLGELRVLLFFRREYFQGDEPVQPRLARLIDRTHPAAAETFEDFQLRKQRRDFRRRGGGCKTSVPCGPVPPGPSVWVASPAFSMHSGQMPPSAVGGTGFPQCGQLL